MRGEQKRREPIEISAEEARQDAPPSRRVRKGGGVPTSLILLFGAGLLLIALAFWIFLALVRF